MVPWGRMAQEYEAMFGLSAADRDLRILGCGDGPACFNAQWTRLGASVTSVDPIYGGDAAAIKQRIDAVTPELTSQLTQHAQDFDWRQAGSVQALVAKRLAAMDEFLRDFEAARGQGRYVPASLPTLPFGKHQFELALVSHFLFLYSQQLSLQFHEQSLAQTLRVAKEVRVYPVLGPDGRTSPHLTPVMNGLRGQGHSVSLSAVDDRFQMGATHMGATHMLRIQTGARTG